MILLARQHSAEFHVGNSRLNGSAGLLRLAQRPLIDRLLGQVDKNLPVLERTDELLVGLDSGLERLLLSEDCLSRVTLVPEAWDRGLLL